MKKIKNTLASIFSRFKLDNIQLSSKNASINISYTNYDAEAAWILYVELLTRVSTQQLNYDCGDERAALKSVHDLFPLTREVLKKYGRKAQTFTKICIIILNQKIRPFTSKWHKIAIQDEGKTKSLCDQFRKELEDLRIEILKYAQLLAEMAHVEDLTCLQED